MQSALTFYKPTYTCVQIGYKHAARNKTRERERSLIALIYVGHAI